jgi:hypothetical protein
VKLDQEGRGRSQPWTPKLSAAGRSLVVDVFGGVALGGPLGVRAASCGPASAARALGRMVLGIAEEAPYVNDSVTSSRVGDTNVDAGSM